MFLLAKFLYRPRSDSIPCPGLSLASNIAVKLRIQHRIRNGCKNPNRIQHRIRNGCQNPKRIPPRIRTGCKNPKRIPPRIRTAISELVGWPGGMRAPLSTLAVLVDPLDQRRVVILGEGNLPAPAPPLGLVLGLDRLQPPAGQREQDSLS